jgi:hypothetical protein
MGMVGVPSMACLRPLRRGTESGRSLLQLQNVWQVYKTIAMQ